jgi:hypothetical protein
MSQQPLSITFTPDKTTLAKGQLHAVEHIQVINSGTKPLTVTDHPATVSQSASGHGCGLVKPVGWMKLNTSSFQLAPGHEKTVTVTVNAPHTATGTTDLAALFTASVHGKGNFHINGSFADQIVVTATGTTHAPVCGHPVALPHSTGGSPPAILLVFLALAVVLTGASMLALRRTWRRRHRLVTGAR